MVLSATQLEELLSGLKSNNRSFLPQDERRSQPRIPVRGKIRITPAPSPTTPSEPFEAYVKDLSRAGIGFIAKGPLLPGQRISATFRRPGGKIATMEYTVRRCQKTPAGWFTIGARLIMGARSPFATTPIKR
jgi:hypothetical protein